MCGTVVRFLRAFECALRCKRRCSAHTPPLARPRPVSEPTKLTLSGAPSFQVIRVMRACVCVRPCVRARVRVCMHVSVRVMVALCLHVCARACLSCAQE